MENVLPEFRDWLFDAGRNLERECERMNEKMEQMMGYRKAFEVAENLLSENERLQEENEGLRSQLQEKEVELLEQRKLTTGMAKKSSEEDLQKALRTYINISKRKTIGKRVAVKTVITEFINTMKITLPDELSESLDSLDDEQNEPQIVIESAADVIAAGGVKNVKIA